MTRRPCARVERVPRGPPARHGGRAVPHQDLPVHAHPGPRLRPRRRARPPGRAGRARRRRTRTSSPRCSAGSWPSSRRRRDAVGGRDRGLPDSTGRSCSWTTRRRSSWSELDQCSARGRPRVGVAATWAVCDGCGHLPTSGIGAAGCRGGAVRRAPGGRPRMRQPRPRGSFDAACRPGSPSPSSLPAGAARSPPPIRWSLTRRARPRRSDATNPYQAALVSSYEAFAADLRPCSSGSGRTSSRSRASPTSGSGPPTASRGPSTSATGIKFSDGTPATSEDACFSWELALDAIKDDTNIGYGYLDPNVKDAGVTKIECPDAEHVRSPTRPTSRTGSSRSTSRSCPSTSGASTTTRRSPTRSSIAPLVGTGAYTLAEWKTGQFARFVRNPNYWGKQGLRRTRSSSSSSGRPTRMVQALKTGEIDYAHDVNPDQFKQLQARPGVHGGRRQGERLDPARLQHLRHRHRQDDQGRRSVDQGAARPGLPRRARLRGRQADARRPRARRLRRRRHDRSSRRS